MGKRKKQVAGRPGVRLAYSHPGVCGGSVLPVEDWERCLTVLQASGWVPAGTLSDSLFWDGSYTVLAGQLVTDQDAQAMATVAAALWDGCKASWSFGLIAHVASQGAFTILPYTFRDASAVPLLREFPGAS